MSDQPLSLSGTIFSRLGTRSVPIKSCCLIPIVPLAILFVCNTVHAASLFVRTNGNDALSGATWELSKQSVTNAVATAKKGDEIWVAAGRYEEQVALKDGIALYGGFAGTETAREQRDWLAHVTVLDGAGKGIVVDINGAGVGTLIDGFTIENGNGTGIRCENTGCTIRNNLIRANLGNSYGGGIYVKGGTANVAPVIEHNRIIDNYTADGGGIGCIDASPRIAYNVIAYNTAKQNGGGVSCWRNSSPRIEGNVIAGNTASWLEATVVPVGGGGVFATADDLDGRPHPTAVSAPVIINNIIAANGGKSGGGVTVIDSNGGVPTIINNTVVANNGSGIYWASSALPGVATRPAILNNLVAFNPWGLQMGEGTPADPNIGFNCVYGNTLQGKSHDYDGLENLTGVNGNISVDPLLANYKFGNPHLQPGSPCIDAGIIPEGAETWLDADEQSRRVGKSIDIGADESDGRLWEASVPVIHVTPNGDDTQDGRSWNTARKTVQAGIDAARLLGAEVWVAGGTYSEHIVLPAFVYLYGGFAGTETDRARRAPGASPSILDGAEAPQVVNCRNAGYLVSALDGFTIQNGGRYTGGSLNKYGTAGIGGGIYVGVASPSIVNNLITHNGLAYDNRPVFPQSPSYGAGIYCYLSYADISGNAIRENEILNDFDGSGAGIYCTRSSLVIRDNTMADNHAVYGAAIYSLGSSPRIIGNLIRSNAMYNTYPLPLYFGSQNGAVTVLSGGDFLIEGNTIEGNTAAVGAGIYASTCLAGRIQNNLIVGNRGYDPTAFGGMGGAVYCLVTTNALDNLYLVHNTMVSNVASTPFGEQGGAIAYTLAPPADKLVIANNVLAFNSSGLFQTLTTPMSRPALLHNDLFNTRSNYINVSSGASDITQDPQFQNSAAGDYRLQPNSPCIDGGVAIDGVWFDLNGGARLLDGDRDGVAAPDVGAYEFDAQASLPGFIEVTAYDGNVILTWNDSAQGMKLQRTSALGSADWQDVAGSELVKMFTVPLESGAAFFRLVKP